MKEGLGEEEEEDRSEGKGSVIEMPPHQLIRVVPFFVPSNIQFMGVS